MDQHDRLACQRKYPKLALVTPRFDEDGSLCVDAPGMKTLRLPVDLNMYGQSMPIRLVDFLETFHPPGEGVWQYQENIFSWQYLSLPLLCTFRWPLSASTRLLQPLFPRMQSDTSFCLRAHAACQISSLPGFDLSLSGSGCLTVG